MTLRFTVLASGSSGNASLVQTDRMTLLLDIGLGPRELAERLAGVGTAWSAIRAVLLTHVHGDHWNEYTLSYLRRLRIPLYCHAEHEAALVGSSPEFAELLSERLVCRFREEDELDLGGGLRCRPLPLRHDSGPTFGFRMEVPVGLFGDLAALGYAADLGSWTAELAGALADVDLLALEFNHDVDMQHASGRPAFLIRRILGDDGHLSNSQAAALLGEILRRSTPGRLQHLVLLHLSRDCNHPRLAQESARTVLGNGSDVTLHTARHDRPSRTIAIGPALVATGAGGRSLRRT
jgi:phosphoribosyl 1,2-cyclic phosphodiesterase